MRTYEETHPWLRFRLDSAHAPPELWVLLGECQARCRQISGVPLRPQTARYVQQRYLARGAWGSAAVSGNALREEDIHDSLEGRLESPAEREPLFRQVWNIAEACTRIRDQVVAGNPPPLSVDRLQELNRLVLLDLESAGNRPAGEAYPGAPREEVAHLVDRLCDWLNGEEFRASAGMAIVQGILKGVATHAYLMWIRPFECGNGRTARLAEYQVLVTSGVPGPAAHLLSYHYGRTPDEYAAQLDKAGPNGGSLFGFVEYAVRGFLEGLRQQLAMIRELHVDVVWRSHVQDSIREKAGPMKDRWQTLVKELSLHRDPVRFRDLLHLSPRLAELYADRTPKTLSRDLAALRKLGLLTRGRNGYRAARERVLGFLPLKGNE